MDFYTLGNPLFLDSYGAASKDTAIHEDHTLWVIMSYMARGSCLHIMKSVFPDSFEEIIATILKEVLKGLYYLHHYGHIHHDIKGVTKGIVAECLLSMMQKKNMLLDFILCIGDDRSYGDMLEVINIARECLTLWPVAKCLHRQPKAEQSQILS